MTARRASTYVTTMRRHRARLRERGLRPVVLWLPDTASPGFQAEIRRQSVIASEFREEKEVLDWIADVMDPEGWE